MRLRPALVTAACAVATAALAFERLRALFAWPATDFDDAYAFLRYARHLAAGHGLCWNVGEGPAWGATGLVHLGAVTALVAARPGWGDARLIQLASIGFAAVAILLLAFACARACPHPWLARRPLAWAAILILLVGYRDAFAFHATTGMDTMSSLAANSALALAVVHLVDRPGRAAALFCALAGWIAWLARPDAALDALFAPLLAIVLAEKRRTLAPWFALPAALLACATLVLERRYAGSFLPIAAWAKRPFAYGGFVGEYTWNPVLFLAVFLSLCAPLLALVVLFARRSQARALLPLLAPPAATCAALFGWNQIMGHLGRFYLPQLAFVAVAAARALEPPLVPSPRRLLARLAVAAVLLAGAGPLLAGAGRLYERRAQTQVLAPAGGYRIAAAEPLPILDTWRSSREIAELARAAPPGTRIALTEHGLVGARAPDVPLDDLAGLNDRAFAHGFSAAALLARRPALIWLPHWDYTQMIRDLLDADGLWRDYDLYPDAFSYGVALRKDAPELLRRDFAARFAAAYPGCALADYRASRTTR
jgi:hypothetical protein